jgi:hypothetical protein
MKDLDLYNHTKVKINKSDVTLTVCCHVKSLVLNKISPGYYLFDKK